MSDLISLLGTLFTFLLNQLSSFANFFTSNTLGIVILGLTIFGLLVNLLVYILHNIR